MKLRIVGQCPMGCGETLAVDARNSAHRTIVCTNPDCERPHAVTALLLAADVIEHQITFDPFGFQIVHPLRERFDNLIARCPLEDYCRGLGGMPVAPGTYIAMVADGHWEFVAVDLAASLAGMSQTRSEDRG